MSDLFSGKSESRYLTVETNIDVYNALSVHSIYRIEPIHSQKLRPRTTLCGLEHAQVVLA